MREDEKAFLNAIREAPDDPGTRLVYADWLDEQGETTRARYIRCRVLGHRYFLPVCTQSEHVQDQLDEVVRLRADALLAFASQVPEPQAGYFRDGQGYDGGLLVSVGGSAEEMLSSLPILCEYAPIRYVRVWGTVEAMLTALPRLARSCPIEDVILTNYSEHFAEFMALPEVRQLRKLHVEAPLRSQQTRGTEADEFVTALTAHDLAPGASYSVGAIEAQWSRIGYLGMGPEILSTGESLGEEHWERIDGWCSRVDTRDHIAGETGGNLPPGRQHSTRT